MLDQLAGRPSPSWRRSQVWLVLLFWLSRFYLSPSRGPRILWLRKLNRLLARKYTPWQIILATCTLFYAIRHGDVLLGLQAPEPLARLYSSDFYRATWIVTALDAGFATAMSIRWKWLRDIASLAFSGYYLLFANEADEKLRKFRAFCTVEMLRTTWEKQGNPYIRFFTRRDRPRISIRKKLFLPRPKGSRYSKPLTLHLFFAGTQAELEASHELVMDIPGGGFICMNPMHHEERLLRWAIQTKRVVISFDYGKAPEYPYPFAIDEMYDAYTLLHETKGRCIGMNRSGAKSLKVLLTGDSAGANIATAMVVKIFEMRTLPGTTPTPAYSVADSLPLPIALNFAYPALSFHFTSWMPSSDLRVLRSESRSDIASLLLRQKDHLEHRSPLAVVEDIEPARSKRPKFTRRRTTSAGGSVGGGGWGSWGRSGALPGSKSFSTLTLGGRRGSLGGGGGGGRTLEEDVREALEGRGAGRDGSESLPDESDKALEDRVLWWDEDQLRSNRFSTVGRAPALETQKELRDPVKKDEALVKSVGAEGVAGGGTKAVVVQSQEGAKEMLTETRLAMTSRTAFFNDRIISPSMARAMALLYVGPRNAPDLHSDYHLSPIFTPSHMLAQFPPVYTSCGERDPLVDDTVIFAGKLREAKEARKMEIQAREARHGDRLRMSSSGTKRDPLLDENEDDWVRMSIIAGWSHGYLQMVSLLPAAEKVIAMHAEWIVEAFEIAAAKEDQARAKEARSTTSTKASSRASPTSINETATQVHGESIAGELQTVNIVPPTPVVPASATLGPATPLSATSQKAMLKVDDTSALSDGEEDEVLTFTPKNRRASSNASRGSMGSGSPPVLPSKVSPPSLSPDSMELNGAMALPPSRDGQHGPPSHLVTLVERAMRDQPSRRSYSIPGSTTSSRPPTPARMDGGARTPSSRSPNPSRTSRPERTLSLSPPLIPITSSARGRSPSGSALPKPQGAVFIDARDLMRRRKEDVVFGIVSGAGSRTSSPPPPPRNSSHAGRTADDGEEDGGAQVDRRRTVE